MKSLPDLICAWPLHLDYPLFRKMIKENRRQFNKVIIVFTDMNVRDPNYKIYAQQIMKDDKVTFMDCSPMESGEDWRNKAMNMALSVSNSEWVYFTEQDFLPVPEFWREIQGLMKRTDVFGRYQGGRLHPCSWFIKRELLNRTSKDFGANGDKGYDHFGLIQRWLDKHDIIMGVIPERLGHHMNGLSQNLHMLQIGLEPNYNPPEFKGYIEDCLKEDMPSDMKTLFLSYLNDENISR